MVHHSSRESALRQMSRAIATTVLQGTPTNLHFLKAVVENIGIWGNFTQFCLIFGQSANKSYEKMYNVVTRQQTCYRVVSDTTHLL